MGLYIGLRVQGFSGLLFWIFGVSFLFPLGAGAPQLQDLFVEAYVPVLDVAVLYRVLAFLASGC